MKKSFTMIEIIFVIVVLAIVAGGTFEFILKLFEGYNRTVNVNRLQTDLDLTLTELSNRLSYRVKNSVIASKNESGTDYFIKVSENDGSYKALEWIGYDREGLMGMWNGTDAVLPGWSGFIDRMTIIDISSASPDNKITTLGSNLNYAKDIIYFLSYNKINLINNTNYDNLPALIFVNSGTTPEKYCWYNKCDTFTDYDQSYIYKVKCESGSCSDKLDSNRNFDDEVDRYYLAWSAYALVLEGSDLKLYYNYQPWNGEKYSDGSSSILLKDIKTFAFKQVNSVLKIKICVKTKDIDDTVYGFCKERSIF